MEVVSTLAVAVSILLAALSFLDVFVAVAVLLTTGDVSFVDAAVSLVAADAALPFSRESILLSIRAAGSFLAFFSSLA
jgi:hypothetical protein